MFSLPKCCKSVCFLKDIFSILPLMLNPWYTYYTRRCLTTPFIGTEFKFGGNIAYSCYHLCNLLICDRCPVSFGFHGWTLLTISDLTIKWHSSVASSSFLTLRFRSCVFGKTTAEIFICFNLLTSACLLK